MTCTILRGSAVLAATLLAGCLDVLGPEVGPPVRTTCFDDDSDPGTDVRFASVFAVLDGEAGCRACHTPDGRTPFGLEASGLDLSTYSTLLAGGARSADTIVVPGQPCASVLIQKVSVSPPFGARMPLDGSPFLSASQRQLLGDWIAEGANE